MPKSLSDKFIYKFIETRLQHICFPMFFFEIFKNTFFTEHVRWLLLFYAEWYFIKDLYQLYVGGICSTNLLLFENFNDTFKNFCEFYYGGVFLIPRVFI